MVPIVQVSACLAVFPPGGRCPHTACNALPQKVLQDHPPGAENTVPATGWEKTGIVTASGELVKQNLAPTDAPKNAATPGGTPPLSATSAAERTDPAKRIQWPGPDHRRTMTRQPAQTASRRIDHLRQQVQQDYRARKPRGEILHDLVLADLPNPSARVLDIGCGCGLDKSVALQQSLAEHCILTGVEPDPDVTPDPCFQTVHRCLFEDAPIPPASIDAAYSVMVLEHVRDPGRFWDKVHDILRPGGVFWALTVDARSLFAVLSRGGELLGLKDLYLDRLRGRRGEARYENYPTYYRANSPLAIRRQTRAFRHRFFLSLYRWRQMDYYAPAAARPLLRLIDGLILACRLPGSVLLVRLQK
jgi:SAM-dependent methyltransferase